MSNWIQVYSACIVAIHMGLLYAIPTVGVMLSFGVIRFPDLTVDGSFALGAAVSAVLICTYDQPLLAMVAAFFGGAVAGLLTGLLHVKLGINKLLCGILVMMILYTITLRIMARSNLPLNDHETMFTKVEQSYPPDLWLAIFLAASITFICILVAILMRTQFGLFFRAAGERPELVVGLGKKM